MKNNYKPWILAVVSAGIIGTLAYVYTTISLDTIIVLVAACVVLPILLLDKKVPKTAKSVVVVVCLIVGGYFAYKNQSISYLYPLLLILASFTVDYICSKYDVKKVNTIRWAIVIGLVVVSTIVFTLM